MATLLDKYIKKLLLQRNNLTMFQEFEIIVVTVEKSLLRMSYENQSPC